MKETKSEERSLTKTILLATTSYPSTNTEAEAYNLYSSSGTPT